MSRCNILIVGGGMAGMSLAAELAAAGQEGVLLIEQEDAPGYHATGRSVAFWEESYGGPQVQPLTTASRPLMLDYLSPRGALHIGRDADRPQRAALMAQFARSTVALEERTEAEVRAVVPGLRAEWTIGLAEPSCADIDAAGLLAHYTARARRGGVRIATATRLLAAQSTAQGWQVETSEGNVSASIIVDAAGAWADDVAQRCGVSPMGITPLRRTVVQLRCSQVPPTLPVVMDLGGQFYFKPSGSGRIWLTPHDESPDVPRDVVAEELDVAIAIDRFEKVVDWRIEAVEQRWAGLRSFAPDRVPVYGFDDQRKGFFWFAGQGGFGIQTAPAAALIGAALITRTALQEPVAHIDVSAFAPGDRRCSF